MAVKVTLGPKGRNIFAAQIAEAVLRNRTAGIGRTRAMTLTPDVSAVEFAEALYPNKTI